MTTAETRRRISGGLGSRDDQPTHSDEASTKSKIRVLTAGSKTNQESSQYTPLTPFTTHGSESPDDNLEGRVAEKERSRISEFRIATAMSRVQLIGVTHIISELLLLRGC